MVIIIGILILLTVLFIGGIIAVGIAERFMEEDDDD